MPRPEPRRGLALAARVAALAVCGALAGPARAEPMLRPSPLVDDDYIESFTFVADLDDGTYVQLQLGVTNLGPRSGTGFCRALVRRPGGEPWTASERIGRRWGHLVTGPAAERLDVGPCSATSGASGTFVRAALGDRAVELTFPAARAPRGAPAAEVDVEGRSYRSQILQAFTPVTARIVGPGQPVSLAGGGYADHSRSNVRYRDLARTWVRFRALRGEHAVVALGRQARDGSWGPAWLWRSGTPAVRVEDVRVARSAPSGNPDFTVTLAGGGVEWRISTVSPLYRFASLSALGLFGRVVAPWVGNPVTYTQRATLSQPGERPIDGILEVSVFEE